MSFLLVIVATIFLLSGLFLTNDLKLIFISIGCSALAGVVLILAVLRSRPRPATASGYDDAGAAESARVATATSSSPAALRGREAGADGSFPIDDYETLEVVEVLPLLGDLTPRQLEQVRQREAAGRAHPWVLARIDALLESEAPTGEVEWAPSEWSADETAAEEPELPEVPEVPEGPEGELEPEWAPARSRSEWSAADFPLEAAGDYDDDIEVVRQFPISHYDDLRANEILPLLSGLDSDELKMVREEEAAGKARTSILSRIDTLLAREGAVPGRGAAPPARAETTAKRAPAKPAARAPSRAAGNLPIENYDSLTVPQITAHLRDLTVPQLKAIRTYEKRHKARAGVLQKIDGAILRAGGR